MNVTRWTSPIFFNCKASYKHGAGWRIFWDLGLSINAVLEKSRRHYDVYPPLHPWVYSIVKSFNFYASISRPISDLLCLLGSTVVIFLCSSPNYHHCRKHFPPDSRASVTCWKSREMCSVPRVKITNLIGTMPSRLLTSSFVVDWCLDIIAAIKECVHNNQQKRCRW